jgi:hypothetical protein
MSENKNSKSKNNQPKETEKLEAELERSVVVAKVKEAHKQIEDIEKSRKRAVAHSICKRISLFLDNIKALSNALANPKYSKLNLSQGIILSMKEFEQTYASIIYDFQKNLDIGQEAMTKMFPTIKIRKDTVRNARIDLMNLRHQLNQIDAYCQRVLV